MFVIPYCEKLQIPQWVRDINEDKGYHGTDIIGYHYYTYKRVTFINETNIDQFPTLVYIIAQIPTYFTGNISSRQSVSAWINELDEVKIVIPQNINELDDLLKSTTNCTEKLLVLVNNENICPLLYWKNIWIIHDYLGVRPVYLSAPLPAAMSVTLYKRLPLLDETVCRQMFLVHQSSYSVLFQDYTPNAVSRNTRKYQIFNQHIYRTSWLFEIQSTRLKR
uniref:Glycosyltransferase family 1 protein n=1 Tax=Angiostrongylus cantonensis TaxID=6313 RepID=A0A0K0D7H4_ANGCA